MTSGPRDANRVPSLIARSSASNVPIVLYADPTTHRLLVDASSAQTGVTNGEAVDAADTGVLSLGTDGTNYRIVKTDADGHVQVDVLSGGGGGVQYTEGDTDASITGTAAMVEGAANALAVMTQPLTDTQLRASAVPVSLASVPSHAVTNAGTFVVQENGAALTALQLIDDTVATTASAIPAKGIALSGTDGTNARIVKTDTSGELQVDVLTMPTVTETNSANALTALQLIDDGVYTDDTSTHSTGTSKGYGIMAAATPTDASVNVNDIGMVAMTTDRKLHVSVQDSLPAGTNAIGKLSANSGVDIGDVDVTSISAGTNLIGDVGIQPRTTNGLDTFMASGSDGSTILVATAQEVKASAGKVYGYYLYNPESAVTFVHFYNTASGSVTVGTTNPLFTLQIPPASAANLMSEIGITFGTAITIAATTTAGGSTAPATGISATIWYK